MPPNQETLLKEIEERLTQLELNRLNFPLDPTSKKVFKTEVNNILQKRTDPMIINGPKYKVVFPGNNIQDAIDEIFELGGGVVFLKVGTHKVTTALTVKSSVKIYGEDEANTIVDFQETAANITLTGTNVYSTGTITSITSGVNVTGSGTAWLANAAAGRHLFLANRWYKIAAVLTDTTLTLAEGYAGNATLPGAAYRIASVITNVDFQEFTLQNSTGTSLAITDIRQFTIKNVTFNSSNVGMSITNGSDIAFDNLINTSHTSDGVQLTNVGFADIESVNSAGNGGHGWTLNNCESIPILTSSGTGNTGDGINITNSTQILIEMILTGNTGQGAELVSGNSFITIRDGFITNNTSDGVKLTATSDNCIIKGNRITGNGGYGVNLAASTCDDNLILGNQFASNTSGANNNSGTGTVIRNNIGLADN